MTAFLIGLGLGVFIGLLAMAVWSALAVGSRFDQAEGAVQAPATMVTSRRSAPFCQAMGCWVKVGRDEVFCPEHDTGENHLAWQALVARPEFSFLNNEENITVAVRTTMRYGDGC
jgi:hypothetical protein